jgi:two-component system OmpR family response regulator
MLTAKGDNVDRVVGLEMGADDYVPKPYFPRELVARLRAVLRRRPQRPAGGKPAQLGLGDLHVDAETRRVSCAGRELELTYSEFKLLTVLLEAGDRVLPKEELSQQVLGRPLGPYDRSIDVHVSNLRQKLAGGRSVVALEAVRGVGYRIVAKR